MLVSCLACVANGFLTAFADGQRRCGASLDANGSLTVEAFGTAHEDSSGGQFEYDDDTTPEAHTKQAQQRLEQGTEIVGGCITSTLITPANPPICLPDPTAIPSDLTNSTQQGT